jgi:hypothetical protein
MARKKGGSKSSKKPKSKTKTKTDKRAYIKKWDDDKCEEVFLGHEKGDYELGEEDLKILMKELERRGLGPFKSEGVEDDEEGDDELLDDSDQVPIGYIKIYPDTPDRNELYRKRYENAKAAWPKTKITKKGDAWFIVAKRDTGSGYDVHLFITKTKGVHGTCTCADFTQRGVRRSFPCKHIFMVLVHEGMTKKW